MTIEDCFTDRKLRVVRPDEIKAKQSLRIARDKYEEALKLTAAGFPKMAVVIAYASMFHAARALLYKDGIQEKSHYCLVVYVRERYVKAGKLPHEVITAMDTYREERNDIFYGFSPPNITDAEAKNAMQISKRMMDAVAGIIGYK